MKVVIGLSGGMDSTTLLGLYLEQGFEVLCCSFKYGSKHELYEIEAAKNIVKFYQRKHLSLKHFVINLQQAFTIFKSNLLLSGGEIPEGHYEEDSMKQTIVPGRNLIMASLLAGIAESTEASYVALGVHAGDHHIYPDCRPKFIEYLFKTIKESSEGKVSIEAIFIDLTKTDILKVGYSLSIPVPYHLTRTCYKNQITSCGKCGSCRERLEAFEEIEIKDPIQYE